MPGQDVIEHNTRFAGRAIQQIYHVDFFNQHGDRVARLIAGASRTGATVPHEQGRKSTRTEGAPCDASTDAELADAYKLYAEEQIRGATPVTGGMSSKAKTAGDAEGTDDGDGFIATLRVGAASTFVRQPAGTRRLIGAIPARHPKIGSAFPTAERVHWGRVRPRVRCPGAYDYGPERCSWLTIS